MTSLSVRGLTVPRGRRTVLEDVSFSAAPGAVTAILGGSEAGKTSLLAAIGGLLPTNRGAVLCDGVEVTALPPRRRGIGLLAPGTALPGGRSTGASIGRLAPRSGSAAVAAVLARLAPGFGNMPPGEVPLGKMPTTQLSHGQALLALAAARLLQPGGVVLVDEAGMGLDDASLAGFAAALRQLAQGGRAVVVATRMARMALLADHLVLLADGRVIQAGTPASLYAEPGCETAASLTGPANILCGRIRELRGQGFVWTGGGRFVQATEPDMPRPALGAEVTLCVRPERMLLLAGGEAAENMVEAEITDVRSGGALLQVWARTAIGDLVVSVPSWQPRFYPASGQQVRIGWTAGAGWVLPQRGAG
jgi:ABC-type Fe3+/spermidine/putrescine transport system ATPase subunit